MHQLVLNQQGRSGHANQRSNELESQLRAGLKNQCNHPRGHVQRNQFHQKEQKNPSVHELRNRHLSLTAGLVGPIESHPIERLYRLSELDDDLLVQMKSDQFN